MRIHRFSYLDAQYSYKKLTSPSKGEVVTYGELIEKDAQLTHIKVAWSKNSDKVYFGLVLPNGCVSREHKAFDFTKGEVIGIYWNDIFLYDENYSGQKNISSMYTEGDFVENIDGHILVHNPETINLTTSKNHPFKKPLTYSIPHGMITSIKRYERES